MTTECVTAQSNSGVATLTHMACTPIVAKVGVESPGMVNTIMLYICLCIPSKNVSLTSAKLQFHSKSHHVLV